jgi:large subunit ribosomal protein L7/L12
MEIPELVEHLSNMKVVDIIELTKQLEEKWGVSAAPVIQQGPNVEPPKEEQTEQTEFDVILTEQGPSKLNVIKVIREITSMALKEAKEFVESAPKPIREGISKDEAEEIAGKVKAAGGSVEIK